MQHKHQGCESVSTLITIDWLSWDRGDDKKQTKKHKPVKE